MRVLLQRVKECEVQIENRSHSSISTGLLIFIGIESEDKSEDIDWLLNKILKMRIFEDRSGKLNKSVLDVKGQLLIVSQFTLYASTKKGNRPSFIAAARPEVALPLYNEFIDKSSESITTKAGVFGADMKIKLINDGPITIWLDSKDKE